MTKHSILKIAMVSLLAVGVIGCGPNVKLVVKPQENVVDSSCEAIDAMLFRARQGLPRDSRVLVASFVDADDLTQSSTLGRLLGEMCAARLSQRGYDVINMKVRKDSVAIRPREGEFLLSRDVKELSQNFKAQAVLVGTYTRTHVGNNIRSFTKLLEDADRDLALQAVENPGNQRTIELINDYVYISLRLINVEDNSVMAAYDYRVPCDEGVGSLLSGRVAQGQGAY